METYNGTGRDGRSESLQCRVCFTSGEYWVSITNLQLKTGLPPTGITRGLDSRLPTETAAPSPATAAERSSGSGGSGAASSSGINIYPAPSGHEYSDSQRQMINAIATNTPMSAQGGPSAACPAERPGGSWGAFGSKIHTQLPSIENGTNVAKLPVQLFTWCKL